MSENLGVIQVDDGAGWTKGVDPTPSDGKKHEHDSATIFKPIMDAIKAIRAKYPSHYIGLTYGANANQSSSMFTLYGFTPKGPPKGPTTINETALGKVDISKMLDIMKDGSNQAEVLYSNDVRNMLLTGGITDKFIIIPFETMNSTGHDDYGHKNDCLAFAEKFLKLPSIIIGWRNGKSTLAHLIDLSSLPTQTQEGATISTMHFAIGGGKAGSLDATATEYINFLIKNWNRKSQKTINSLLEPVLPKKEDGKPPTAAATAATTSSVTKEQIASLQERLETARSKVDTADKTTALGIAQEIFNVFFGGDDKSKTKEFLTDQVAKLTAMPIFTDDKHKLLDSISTRLAGITDAAATVKSGEVKKPVGPATTKKYVFAFDIDDTLVQSGTLVKTKEMGGRSTIFDTSTHATDYDAMITLMKKIIDAEHHVWIVTANTNIAKATFDTNYLKADTKITDSPNYYFMNPATVAEHLKLFFDKGNISTYLTDTDTTKTLDLSFNSKGDGGDFQKKGLKPYAMIAKWLELKNPNMNDVKMYLFDDSANYGTTCENVKGDKIEFVKITPVDSSAGVPGQFKSDVLTKANEKFVAIAKTTEATPKAAVISGGRNLNVMTFNTWYEAFSPNGDTMYCGTADNNRCTDAIMKTIVARMKEGGPQVIFLQEFTSRFDDFFKKEGVAIGPKAGSDFESTSKVQTTLTDGSKKDTAIPQLRHFTMTVSDKKFYVYTATIVDETITTIYSSDLRDASADAFFIGNTTTVRNSPNDNSPYFWNDNKAKANETSWIFGGARPYIVLEFKDMNLVLINLHSQHDDPFRPPKDKTFAEDQLKFISGFKKENNSPNSVQTYAFTVLGTMLRDKSRISKLDDYNIIIGGDFNAEPERTLKLLNLSLGHTAKFTDGGITRKTAGNTCCTTKEGDKFVKAGDQIYSRGLSITTYKVHETATLTLGTGKSTQNFFSDHLPVYATVTLPPVATGASASALP